MVNLKSILWLVLTFVLALATVSSALAYMPAEHYTINREAFEKAPNSPMAVEIKGYEDYFFLCNQLTDISVVMYSLKWNTPYTATHDQTSCLNSLPKAQTTAEKACGYGICAHHSQDTIAHNELVPRVILKTKMPNGLIHSIMEFKSEDINSNHQDFVNSRRILSKANEMVPYLTKVFGTQSAFQSPNIPSVRELVDTYVLEVGASSGYSLGFKSFFSLPTPLVIIIFLLFFIALTMFSLSIRRIINKKYNITTLFTSIFSFILLAVVSLAIYAFISGKIIEVWEDLSIFLFSSAMYPIGGAILIIGLSMIYLYVKSGKYMENIGTLAVILFMVIIGGWLMTFPTALDLGGSVVEDLHDKAVTNTVLLLNGGTVITSGFKSPSGYVSIPEAEAQTAGARTVLTIVLIALLLLITYLTFRKERK